jgi:hypothetical protein
MWLVCEPCGGVAPPVSTVARWCGLWRGLWREALKALPRPAKVQGKIRLNEADALLLDNTIGRRWGKRRIAFLMAGAVLRSLGLSPVEVVFSTFLK